MAKRNIKELNFARITRSGDLRYLYLDEENKFGIAADTSSSLLRLISSDSAGSLSLYSVLNGRTLRPSGTGNNTISLGADNTRYKTIYGVDGNFKGDLIVTGTINGVAAASLVSLDDLKTVLSEDQVYKLSAKLNQRQAILSDS